MHFIGKIGSKYLLLLTLFIIQFIIFVIVKRNII